MYLFPEFKTRRPLVKIVSKVHRRHLPTNYTEKYGNGDYNDRYLCYVLKRLYGKKENKYFEINYMCTIQKYNQNTLI